MLSLFSIPKAFRGHIADIQFNAIKSWTLLNPRPDVILLGNEYGIEAISKELHVRQVTDIARNEFGTPLISSAFSIADRISDFNLLCYINSDIILLSEFIDQLSRIEFKNFLAIGRRWNLEVKGPIDFSDSNWEWKLRQRVSAEGQIHSHWGVDYFMFRQGSWAEIPPFAIGRLMWDNWLIYNARRLGFPVIDTSGVIMAIHQNHDYPISKKTEDGGWDWQHPEIQRNLELAGGHECGYNLHDATWVLRASGLWPAFGRDYLQQRLYRYPFRLTQPTFRVRLLRQIILAAIFMLDTVEASRQEYRKLW